jgi:hypothetical protein
VRILAIRFIFSSAVAPEKCFAMTALEPTVGKIPIAATTATTSAKKP